MSQTRHLGRHCGLLLKGRFRHPAARPAARNPPGALRKSGRCQTLGVFAVRAAGMYRYSVAGKTPRRCAISVTPRSGLANIALAAVMSALAPKATLPAGRETGWSGWFSAVHSLSLNFPWAVALSQVGHAAASFRDIPADLPRVEPQPMVWRPIAIAAQKFVEAESGCRSRARTAVGHC